MSCFKKFAETIFTGEDKNQKLSNLSNPSIDELPPEMRCWPSGAYGRFWHTGGMASCGMGSPGMAMCGMARCGMAMCDMARCGMAMCGMARCGMARCGMGAWHLVLPEIFRVRVITLNGHWLARHGKVRHGKVGHGKSRHGKVRHGLFMPNWVQPVFWKFDVR